MTNPLRIAGPAIMKVLSVGESSRDFIGTAFAVNDRVVLTCRHVVQKAKVVGNLVLDCGHLGDVGRLDWSAHEDPALDVAVGITDKATFHDWLTPACIEVGALATPITCVGYGSEGRGVECWQDRVAGEVRAYGLVTLQNTLHKGCSGGPVLDGDGRPVAIIVARHQDGAAKYILPVRSFYAWMQQGGYRPMEHGRKDGAVEIWLLKVPIGPYVPIHEVPAAVIDAFARTFPSEKPARDHLASANALVLKSNPEGLKERQITLQEADQPAFDVPRTFWSTVFSTLGTRSRRSVAALLEADGAPSPLLQHEKVRREFENFRKYLLNAS